MQWNFLRWRKTMGNEKAIEEMKKSIVSMLMKIYDEERLRMIETFLLLTLKREEKEKDQYV